VGGLSGSFGHNTAGLRGGFSCLIRALGFVTSSWVRLTHIVCALTLVPVLFYQGVEALSS
jgi:hypothetical protein